MNTVNCRAGQLFAVNKWRSWTGGVPFQPWLSAEARTQSQPPMFLSPKYLNSFRCFACTRPRSTLSLIGWWSNDLSRPRVLSPPLRPRPTSAPSLALFFELIAKSANPKNSAEMARVHGRQKITLLSWVDQANGSWAWAGNEWAGKKSSVDK